MVHLTFVKWSISIDTMTKFDGDADGDWQGTCKGAFTLIIFGIIPLDILLYIVSFRTSRSHPADLTKQALSSSSSTSSTPSNDSDQSDGRSEYSSVSSLSLASSGGDSTQNKQTLQRLSHQRQDKNHTHTEQFHWWHTRTGYPRSPAGLGAAHPSTPKPPGYWRNVASNTRMGRLPHLYKHGPKINNFATQPRVFHS